MNAYVSVFVGGCLGAIARYGLSLSISTTYRFPYETLTANWLGCFLLTYLMAHPYLSSRLSTSTRIGLGTGLLGAFTTFSTFTIETIDLWINGLGGQALLYIFLSIFGGISLAWAGFRMARIGGKSV
ncbi:fluoride efflux transporter CrcB [Pontibacillus salicampi]|uniref:Fluoride-specific ion channel FluC n=1 Tax=Pontibacillus salicampi TaxID=1449801 RepID=A0ABV6LN34_9BACI